MDKLENSIRDVADGIKQGEISSEELVKSCIKKIEDQKNLGAILFFDETKEKSIAQAREIDKKIKSGIPMGALAGVPFLVKDNIDVAGVSTTAASLSLFGNKPKKHSPVVERLINEGAIMLAKANMHELAFGITSINASCGDVHNFYDNQRIAGGSSGGSAVGVSAGMASFALGTDTGGSTRIPPALNGVVGFRPTLNRYSQKGIIPISSTRDTIGLITREIDDVDILDQIISGDQNDMATVDLKRLRLGVPRGYYYQNLSSEVASLTEQGLEKLSKLGITLIEEDIPNLAELDGAVSFIVALYEAKIDLLKYFEYHDKKFNLEDFISKIQSPDVRATYEFAVFNDFIKKEQYQQAINQERPKLIQAIDDYYKKYHLDAIVFPMTPLEACLISEVKNNKVTYDLVTGGKRELTVAPGNDMIFSTYIQNADPGSNAGLPGITLPIGLTNQGLLVGLGIDSQSGQDRKLIAIAKTIEDKLIL